MYCIRAKFIRGEELKFISHLDIMRIFERALRRSHLPVKYSEGFNPRPEMVFGLPLSVGVTSEAEYADFMMDRNISPVEFLDLLNLQMPSGLKIVAAMQRRGKNNIMASITAALYGMSLFSEAPDFLARADDELKRLMSLSEIIIGKKGKHGLKPVNIRPLILKANREPNGIEGCIAVRGEEGHAAMQQAEDHDTIRREEGYTAVQGEEDFTVLPQEEGHFAVQRGKDYTAVQREKDFAAVRENNGQYRVRMSVLVSAGSKDNLNPRLLIEALKDDVKAKVLYAEIHRKELYIKKGEGLAVPFDE